MPAAHYIFVIGPHDSTCIGPFRGRFKAEVYNEYLHDLLDPNVFDTQVWTRDEYDANVRAFGGLVCVSAEEYDAAGA
jgi:hypothetical protein